MIVWLLLAVAALWVVAYRYRRRRMYALASKIPAGADERPLTGVAHKFMGSTEDIMSSLQDLSYSSIENNGMVRMWLGHILYLIATDPVDIEAVLKNCLEKDDLHRFLRKFIGNGLIFAPVSIWRPRRKIMVRAFTPKVIESFVPIFAEQSMKLAGKVGEHAGGDRFSAWPFISSYTLDSVCDTTLGVKINAQEDNNAPFLVAVNMALEMMCKRIFHLWLQPDWLYRFFPDYIRSENCLKVANGLINDVIKKKRVELKTDLQKSPEADHDFDTTLGVKINAQEDNNAPFLVAVNMALEMMCKRIFHLWLQPDWLYRFFPDYIRSENCLKVANGLINDVIKKKRVELKTDLQKSPEADHDFEFSNYTNKTFLDLLIRLSGGEKGYSDLELREETLTLTIAATDTSATAIGYALQMLAKYPDVQDKVIQELDEVFGDSDRLFAKEDLARLNYLERVIKETLRLFPPVPFIIRKVEEEIALPSGRVLPAGSGVGISIWGTHRNPKYWGPDAEQFDPDRFLPERLNLKHPCAFLPFSNGPRNCVGYQYAMMSIKAAMSSMLRYNRVVSDPETKSSPQIRVKLDIMMKAVDGYEIALQRRRPLV